mgnify:CR=1 FL=1
MAHKINEKNRAGNLARWPVGLNQERQRTRRDDPDAFVNGAEKQNLNTAEETRKLDPETRARLRSRGDKINIYVIRGTRQQRELLKHAAEKENTSMQKLIWDHLIRELEEKHGADLPLNNL